MKLILGADHAGWEMKESLKHVLLDEGFEVEDVSESSLNPDDDYPLIAARAAQAVKSHNERAILLCGSGQGVLIAANRFPHIRAALGVEESLVRSARTDDDVNTLALPARFLTSEEALTLTRVFIETPFRGADRDLRRIQELSHLPSV